MKKNFCDIFIFFNNKIIKTKENILLIFEKFYQEKTSFVKKQKEFGCGQSLSYIFDGSCLYVFGYDCISDKEICEVKSNDILKHLKISIKDFIKFSCGIYHCMLLLKGKKK
jgi:hypothetical protein